MKVTELIESLKEVYKHVGDIPIRISRDIEGNGFSSIEEAILHIYNRKLYIYHEGLEYGE